MRSVTFARNLQGVYLRQLTQDDSTDAISISFSLGWHIVRRKLIEFDDGILATNAIDWIWNRGKDWYIDLGRLKQNVESFNDIDWLQGVATVEPGIRKGTGDRAFTSFLIFTIYQDEFVVDRKRRIFLSHKGADKPLVRQYRDVLKAIGFDPWLDEDALPAGAKLERGILQGFEESCAAVFFITPQFKDEEYLASEVEYAMRQHRDRPDRFKIIALLFKDVNGSVGDVPGLLKDFVYKTPESDLMALLEILRGLPIEPGEPRWRANINPA